MTLADQLIERRKQWQAFHEWDDSYVHPARPASKVLADISVFRSWLPDDVRNRDPDPEKLGIQRLRKTLALLPVADD